MPGCNITFNDGLRRVDFVLVWQEPRGGQDASKKRALFESRLVEEGLHLEAEPPIDRLHFVKIHAPPDVLKRYCEILRLRMPMKQTDSEGSEGAGEVIVSRVKSLVHQLTSCLRLDPAVFPPDKFTLTAEYSRHKSFLFNDGREDFFTSQARTLVVDFILERTSFSHESELVASAVGIQKLISDDVYKAAYPLHDGTCDDSRSLRRLLLVEWAQVKHWAKYQPVDQIREYFGVKYALYFAWLGFYTHMLVPASIVGLLVFLYGCATLYRDNLSRDICDDGLNITMCPLCDATCDYWRLSDTCTYAKVNYLIDNPLTVFFAIFMSFWATLFLELWKRYSASVAHRWGLTDYCPQSEPPRAQYLARVRHLQKSRARRPGTSTLCKTRKDHVTGLSEPYVSFWRVFLPQVAVAVVAVFGVVLYRMCVLTSVRLTGTYDETSYAIIVVPSTAAIINLICIMILNWVSAVITRCVVCREEPGGKQIQKAETLTSLMLDRGRCGEGRRNIENCIRHWNFLS
ncbi:hypothetical protein AAG570_007382 [Ranatra chinensis]|uniref:Anoctamin n=1 Tax=Ranatra chinensis TaxID=642074 RepID=A0ABD0XVP6_9HEMI